MGKGKGTGKGVTTENCRMFSVLILNSLCGLLGALLFSLAIWLRVENEVRDWVRELGMYQYWNGLYILMAAGAIIVIISFIGCGGALTGNPCLLGTNLGLTSLSFVMCIMGAGILLANCIRPTLDTDLIHERFDYVLNLKNYRQQQLLVFLYYRSAMLVLLALILELSGGIYILVNGTETSKLQPWLQKTFDKLILDSNYNGDAYRILQKVQEKVGCCGALNYQDYDRHRLPISDFCRDKISGNVYSDGCVKRFSLFIEKRAGWIAGIALFIGALQLLLVAFTFCHWRNSRYDTEEDVRRRKYDSVPTHVN